MGLALVYWCSRVWAELHYLSNEPFCPLGEHGAAVLTIAMALHISTNNLSQDQRPLELYWLQAVISPVWVSSTVPGVSHSNVHSSVSEVRNSCLTHVGNTCSNKLHKGDLLSQVPSKRRKNKWLSFTNNQVCISQAVEETNSDRCKGSFNTAGLAPVASHLRPFCAALLLSPF